MRDSKIKWLLQIALLAAGLAWCAPVHAQTVWTLSQHRMNVACGNVASCNVAGFSAVAAGSFIFEHVINEAAAVTATTGASGGGSWVLPSGCTGTSSCATSTALLGSAVAYVASSTGSPTTLTCTASSAVIDDCEIIVLTFTNGPITMDVGAVTTRTAAVNVAGISAGTLTGTSDFIFQYGTFAGSASGCPNSAASPNDFPNGNASCGLINSTNTTAGTYTNTSGAAAIGAIAFKGTAAASTFKPQIGGMLVGF